jgi:signal transduction histidine kinase
MAGVLQLAFPRPYPWLPRERDLLVVAGERCLSGVEKARLTENLARSEEEVRHLATRLLQVEEMERRRISRELHDEAGQSLLCIRLRLEMLERAATPESRHGIAEVRVQVERTIDEVRRLIGALSPSVLDRFGLAAALRQVAATLRKLHGLSVRLEASVPDTLPERVQLVAYRLVQECCNNIVKHASAREVKFSVRSTDKSLRLDIHDDGIGFDVAEALTKRSSFGITGMKERVALLGGKFQIRSAGPETSARKGTRVQIELPITDETYG